MIENQILPGYNRHGGGSFNSSRGTLAHIIADVAMPVVAPAITSETAIPGESTVRQRVLVGGQNLTNVQAASTDAAAKSLLVYLGEFMYQTSISITGTNSINAAANPFLTAPVDGNGNARTPVFKVGQQLMLFDPGNAANEGVLCVLTGVAAGALTVSGTPLTNDSAATTRIFRVFRKFRVAVPANAGNSDSVPAVAVFGNVNDPGVYALNPIVKLGAYEALIMAMVAATSGVTSVVDVTCEREFI